MSSSDPWASIAAPSTATAFNGRRAAVEHPFDFWWGRDIEGRRLLALMYAADHGSDQPRPDLNGIDILELEPALGGRAAFILALRQHDAAEPFLQLCRDLMAVAADCADERSALRAVISRAWKWHGLLRSGGSGRLSEAEQQGLFGEILVLRKIIRRRGATAALAAWRGPLGEPKDFRIGGLAIEVKTLAAGLHGVQITSADQLDPAGIPRLILAAVHLAPTGSGATGACSLDELVAALRTELAATAAAERLDALLAAAGWSPDTGYDGVHWLELGIEHYAVEADFPRIAASGLPPGVEQVRYRLDLDACSAFVVEAGAVEQWLGSDDLGRA